MFRFGRTLQYEKGKRHSEDRGGHDFVEVEALDFDATGRKILIPFHPADDKKHFPGGAVLEEAGFLMRSGVAAHKLELGFHNLKKIMPDTESVLDDFAKLDKRTVGGIRATELEVFHESHWYGECFAVLSAHGWLGKSGELASHIIDHVVEHYGQSEIDEAKEQYGTEWEPYIKELAAVRLAKPLSRLWYAANMLSLYYIHHDEMRLGYLWAEYKMRLRHEQDSFRGKKSVESARGGGEQRAKHFQNKRGQIFEAMTHFIRGGHSIANAARQAHKSGFGVSAEANRKLWNRHHEK